MPINFKEKFFNHLIYKLIHGIYHKAHKGQTILNEDLKDLHKAFIDHYVEEKRANYSEHENIERANEVYSQFLQNLFYYCVLNIKDQQYVNKLLNSILTTEEKFIFYKSFFDKKLPVYIIWNDPIDKGNILNCLCGGDYSNILSLILKRVKTILNENQYKAFITNQNKHGFTPLNSAATIGNLHACKLLLEEAYLLFQNDTNGFENFLTQKDSYGFTPLLSACKANQYEIVELLLKISIIHNFSLLNSIATLPTWESLKQQLNDKDYVNFEQNVQKLKNTLIYDENKGFTPLIAACKYDDLNTLNQLLMAASIAFKNDLNGYKMFLLDHNQYGFTALITAVKTNSYRIVKQLLVEANTFFKEDLQNYKAFLTQKSKDGFFPLNLACSNGNLKIINELFKAISIAWDILPLAKFLQTAEERNIIDYTTITTTLGNEELGELKNVLMQRSNEGYFPLISACKEGHLNIVCQLMAIASMNAQMFKEVLMQQNNEGYSPLISSCTEGYLHVVEKLLLIASADLDLLEKLLKQKNKDGYTALISACSRGHLDIVTLLLRVMINYFGNKPQFIKDVLLQQNMYGFSPLISATKDGYVQIISELIRVAFNVYGFGALLDRVVDQCPRTFNESSFHLSNQLFNADPQGLKDFLMQQNKHEFSAFNTAASMGHFDIVDLLLVAARITFENDHQGFIRFLEQKNKFGFTPLNAAVKNNLLQIAERLYAEGADPNNPNKQGYTAKNLQPKNWNLFSTYNESSASSSTFTRHTTGQANSAFFQSDKDRQSESKKRKLENVIKESESESESDNNDDFYLNRKKIRKQ